MKIDLEELKSRISREDLLSYYKIHNFQDTRNHFKLSESALNRLKSDYNIVKTQEDIEKTKQLTNLEKFGVSNPFKNLTQCTENKKNKTQQLLENFSIEVLRQDYLSVSEEEFIKKYDITSGVLQCLKDNYGLKLSLDEINKKKVIVWRNKDTSFETQLHGYASKIGKENFIQYYIEENHTFEETTDYFHIHSMNYTLALIKLWGCYKEHTSSNNITKQTKLLRYQDANYNNRIAAEKTCMEKYGVDNVSKDPTILHKIISNRASAVSNSGKNYSVDSKPNLEFKSMLQDAGISFIREFPLETRSYDFKVNNNLIEINPAATHNSTFGIMKSAPALDSNYHFNKTQVAVKNGYKCIHVWDWDDKNKIISLLTRRPKCFARKCEIREVPVTDCKDFLNFYHLQGATKTPPIRLGLYYNKELVSVMTFDRPRYNKKYEYELLRYCSSYEVIGGVEKLFAYFVKNYSPRSIISYCDLSKFSGSTYDKLKFTRKTISIGKHWYNDKTKEHVTDNLLRQRGFDQLFGTAYGKGASNENLMKQHGFVEIYDAGQATYIKIF